MNQCFSCGDLNGVVKKCGLLKISHEKYRSVKKSSNVSFLMIWRKKRKLYIKRHFLSIFAILTLPNINWFSPKNNLLPRIQQIKGICKCKLPFIYRVAGLIHIGTPLNLYLINGNILVFLAWHLLLSIMVCLN